MFDLDRMEEIWETITRNKWRSFMTAMGVFWGVFMLVVMSGAGRGIGLMLRSQVSLTENAALFFSAFTSEPYKGFKKGRYWTFKMEDLSIIKQSVEGVEDVVGFNWGTQVNVSNDNNDFSSQLMGLHPSYTKIEPLIQTQGRFINDLDVVQKRKVCTIGKFVYEKLFPEGGDVVGKDIMIGKSKFTVIGVHENNGNVSIGGLKSEQVIAPISVTQQLYNKGDDISAIAVVSKPGVLVSSIEDEVMSILRKQHDVSPTDKKAVSNFNFEEQFMIFKNLFLGLDVLTWIVGLGTLFAGVIGVSNIMLIVVKERTQEIGVRRALGATPAAIISQIMSESFVLTFIAGVAGLGASVGLLALVESVMASNGGLGGMPFSPQITFSVAVTAALVILISGLFSGIIPALRAMSIKAVDAIREE